MRPARPPLVLVLVLVLVLPLVSCGRCGFELSSTTTTDAGADALAVDGDPGDAALADATPACTAGTAAYPTVQSGIDDPACAVVRVPTGTWEENLIIARDLSVVGAGPDVTLLSGGGAGRVVRVDGAARVTLEDLQVTLGSAANGAGISSTGPLVLSNVRVTGNSASGAAPRGGGVEVVGAVLTLAAGTEIDTNEVRAEGTGVALAGFGAGAYLEGAGADLVVSGAATVRDNTLTVRQDGGAAIAAGGGIALRSGARLLATGGALTVQDNLVDQVTLVSTAQAARAAGGGVYCELATVDVSGLVANGNRVVASVPGLPWPVAHGGGLAADQCTVTVRGSSFDGNTVYAPTVDGLPEAFGGALFLADSVSSISQSSVTNSEVRVVLTGSIPITLKGGGGGLCIRGGTTTIADSSVANNDVVGTAASAGGPELGGGGVAVVPSAGGTTQVSIERSTIGPGNSVLGSSPGGSLVNVHGGGVSVSDLASGDAVTVDVVNSTISGNTVEGMGSFNRVVGGGVGVHRDRATDIAVRLIHVTVSSNQGIGASMGGGVGAWSDEVVSDLLISQNSIFWDNLAATVGTANCATNNTLQVVRGRMQIGDFSGADCASDLVAGASIGVADPEIAGLADNGGATLTHAISASSPARDTAVSAECVDAAGAALTIDQRGLPRATCDVGAYEVQ